MSRIIFPGKNFLKILALLLKKIYYKKGGIL